MFSILLGTSLAGSTTRKFFLLLLLFFLFIFLLYKGTCNIGFGYISSSQPWVFPRGFSRCTLKMKCWLRQLLYKGEVFPSMKMPQVYARSGVEFHRKMEECH